MYTFSPGAVAECRWEGKVQSFRVCGRSLIKLALSRVLCRLELDIETYYGLDCMLEYIRSDLINVFRKLHLSGQVAAQLR